MILTGPEIGKQVRAGRIHITPFDDSRITTNSYDLRLGEGLIRYQEEVVELRKDNAYERMDIPAAGHPMAAGDFLLGETHETIGSDHFVPVIHARSGIARLGLFVHVTADLFDIGYVGKSTLQLHATLPIVLRPMMEVAQVSFWVPTGDIELYQGKYQGGIGAQPSRSHEDHGAS